MVILSTRGKRKHWSYIQSWEKESPPSFKSRIIWSLPGSVYSENKTYFSVVIDRERMNCCVFMVNSRTDFLKHLSRQQNSMSLLKNDLREGKRDGLSVEWPPLPHTLKRHWVLSDDGWSPREWAYWSVNPSSQSSRGSLSLSWTHGQIGAQISVLSAASHAMLVLLLLDCSFKCKVLKLSLNTRAIYWQEFGDKRYISWHELQYDVLRYCLAKKNKLPPGFNWW